MFDLFFQWINGISVAFMLGFSLIVLVIRLFRKQEVGLHQLLSPALSAATIPTGLALIVCAFEPHYVSRLESFNIHLSIAGIALLYVAVATIMTGLSTDRDDS